MTKARNYQRECYRNLSKDEKIEKRNYGKTRNKNMFDEDGGKKKNI